MKFKLQLLALLCMCVATLRGQIPSVPTNLSGSNYVCPGATLPYSVFESPGATFYHWTSPVGSYINNSSNSVDLPAPDGLAPYISFGNVGGQVCVAAGNSFGLSAPVCMTVTSQVIPPTILPEAKICAEDAPYQFPWGQTASVSGTYTITLQSWLGCDSLVKQKLTILPPIVVNLSPRRLCVGECFQVAGEELCQDGVYSVTTSSYRGCDSIINVAIQILKPNAVINTSNTVISCVNPTVLLSGMQQLNQGPQRWVNQSWQTIGTGATLQVNTPGVYHYITSVTGGGVNCFDTAGVTVTGALTNLTANIVQQAPANPDCNNPQTILAASSNSPAATYSWGTANGFISTQQNPVVTQSGVYTVTVTDINGCTGTSSATVVSETQYETATAKICPGETYMGHTQPGDYPDTLQTYPCGCYRIRLLHLEETNIKTTEVNAGICPGSSYGAYSQPGTYQDVFNVSAGCDSLRILHLSILPPVSIAATTKPDNGSGNGTIALSLSGGLPPYRVHWNTGDTLAAIGNLHTGLYFADVADAAGCVYSEVVKVPFKLDSVPPIGPLGIPFIPDPPAEILGLNHVCPGATAFYSIVPSTGAGFYIWSLPNGAFIDGSTQNPDTINTPDGWDAYIHFASAGGQICVSAGTADGVSAPTCMTVTNTPIPPTILPNVIVCAEEMPYHLPWGDVIYSSGTYSTTLTSWLGCDSMVRQTVKVLQPIVKNLGSIYICQGNCVFIGAEEFCDSGPFQVVIPSFFGCDSVIHGQIIQVLANASISPANPGLNCMNGTALLSAAQAANNGSYTWKNSQWQTIGTTQNITVNAAGTYHLIVSNILGAVICRDTATVTVAGFSGAPVVTINQLPPAVPDCNNPQTILAASSNIPGVVYSWAAPFGFNSFLQNPIVTQSGTYTVTVTATATGCTGTASTTVFSENQYESTTVKICPGETYGAYTQPGDYMDTLETFPCGCHRIRTLHLEETNLKTSEVSVSICPGASYGPYSQPGTYLDTFNVSTGCDSLRVLHLSVLTHVSISVTTKSDNGSGIGSLSLSFNGGLPPYRVRWSNGDTLAAIDHLISGFYFVEVTDAAGCTYGYLVKVPFELDTVPPIGPLSTIDLYPNPAQTSVVLKTPEDFQGSVYFVNQLGQTKKIVAISEHKEMAEISVDLSGLPAGIYMVVFEMKGQGREVRRLWVDGGR